MPERPPDNIDFKLREADFFLDRLREAEDLMEANFYLSAFVSAARSVTFAVQAVMRGVPEFDSWYGEKQAAMQAHPLARQFIKIRNAVQKEGTLPVTGGTFGSGVTTFYLDDQLTGGRCVDVVDAGREYMALVVDVVYELYERFGGAVDPVSYAAASAAAEEGASHDELVDVVTGMPGCDVDDLFEKYLGRERSVFVPARSS